jgi:LPS-assembly protein
MRMRTLTAGVMGVLMLVAGVARSQPPSTLLGVKPMVTATSAVPAAPAPIDIDAKVMEYDRSNNVVIASSNVIVRRGTEEMRADVIRVNVVTSEAEAHGHVVFTRPGNEWRGNYLRYNFATKEWNTGAFTSYFSPFYIRAQSSAMTNQEYELKKAYLTTCTNDYTHEHFHFTCRTLRVKPGDRMKGKHVVAYLGPVPVFYFPWMYRSLGDRSVGFSADAGYSGRMGAFLLTSTKYWMSPNLRAVTQIDGRTERGVGLGQEVGWYSDDRVDHGRVYGYYINDNGVKKDFEGGDRELVEAQRYRLRMDQSQTLSDRDYFLADVNYLSDPFVVEDFFNSEHRGGFQPDNFATLAHRGDAYAASLSAHKRLNDFYTAVDRLPEGQLDLTRQQLGTSPFFYDSVNSVASLQKLFAEEDSEETDHSAVRFNSAHTVYYPNYFFGFLNVTPRAGYQATYYSETIKARRESGFVTVTNSVVSGSTTSVVTRVESNTVTVLDLQGSGLRSIPSVGLETSFRAFKVLDNDETIFGTGLRHVAEPYANYTYVPEPNLTADELYQFDSIDGLGKNHSITFGLRNRMQTKRDLQVFDFLDFDVNTQYRIEDHEDEPFGNINTTVEFRPSDWATLYGSVAYNPYDSVVQYGDLRSVINGDIWRTMLEYYYRNEESSLVSGDLAWSPNKRWTYGLYGRYEMEDSRLEEQRYYIGRTLDCLAYTLGLSHLPSYTRSDGSEREDEFRVIFQLSLTAFPNVRVGVTPRN